MLRRSRDSRVVFATMRTGALIAGLVAVLALAGCGGEDESPAEPGEPGGAQLGGSLTYSRGGGIEGRMDKLVVRPDGTGDPAQPWIDPMVPPERQPQQQPRQPQPQAPQRDPLAPAPDPSDPRADVP